MSNVNAVFIKLIKKPVIRSCSISQQGLYSILEAKTLDDCAGYKEAINNELRLLSSSFKVINLTIGYELVNLIAESLNLLTVENKETLTDLLNTAFTSINTFIDSVVDEEDITYSLLTNANVSINTYLKSISTDYASSKETTYEFVPGYNKSHSEPDRKKIVTLCQSQFNKTLLLWMQKNFPVSSIVNIKKVCEALSKTVSEEKISTFFWLAEGICELLEHKVIQPAASIKHLRKTGVILDLCADTSYRNAGLHLEDDVVAQLQAVVLNAKSDGAIVRKIQEHFKDESIELKEVNVPTVSISHVLPLIRENIESAKIHLQRYMATDDNSRKKVSHSKFTSDITNIVLTIQMVDDEKLSSLSDSLNNISRRVISDEELTDESIKNIFDSFVVIDLMITTLQKNRLVVKIFGDEDPTDAITSMLHALRTELKVVCDSLSNIIGSGSYPSELQPGAMRISNLGLCLRFISSEKTSNLLLASANIINNASLTTEMNVDKEFKAAITSVTAVQIYIDRIIEGYTDSQDLLDGAISLCKSVGIDIYKQSPLSTANSVEEESNTNDLSEEIDKVKPVLDFEKKGLLHKNIESLISISVDEILSENKDLIDLVKNIKNLHQIHSTIFDYERFKTAQEIKFFNSAIKQLKEYIDHYLHGQNSELVIDTSIADSIKDRIILLSLNGETEEAIKADEITDKKIAAVDHPDFEQKEQSNGTANNPEEDVAGDFEEEEYDAFYITLYKAELEKAEPLIREACKTQDDEYVKKSLFRAIHTLKGSASSSEIHDIAEILSPIEDYIDHIAKNNMEMRKELFPIIEETLEIVTLYFNKLGSPREIRMDDKNNVLDNILKNFTLDEFNEKAKPKSNSSAEKVSSDIVKNDLEPIIGSYVDKHEDNIIESDVMPGSVEPAEEGDDDSDFIPVDLSPDEEEVESPYENDLLEFFITEADEELPNLKAKVVAWEREEYDDEKDIIEGIKRGMHTLKGGAGMAQAESLMSVFHNMESIIEQILFGVTKKEEALFIFISKVLEEIDEGVEKARKLEPYEASKKITDAIDKCLNDNVFDIEALEANIPIVMAEEAEQEEKPETKKETRSKAQRASKENESIVNVVGTSPSIIIAKSIAKRKKQLLAEKNKMPPVSKIKINSNLIESLVNLSNEGVAEFNRYSTNAEKADQKLKDLRLSIWDVYSNAEDLPRQLAGKIVDDKDNLNDVAYTLEKILNGIQSFDDDILQVIIEKNDLAARRSSQEKLLKAIQADAISSRLVPFSNISQNFSGVINQTAKSLDKEIEINMVGVSTKVDRSLLDALADPIMHILRNAADHGIENKEEYAVSKKKEKSSITINVSQSNNNLVIKISDNGKGLNLEKIRGIAVKRNLIKEDAKLSDYQIQQLITSSGFSTASSVTSISGRGVGMDIVKKAVEKEGGHLRVSSKEGQGTTFKIEIPSTIGTSTVFLCKAAGMLVNVPMSSVITVEYKNREEVGKIRGESAKPIIMHDETPYVLVKSNELFGVNETEESPEENTPLLFVSGDDLNLCVEVDEIIDMVEVYVKKAPKLLDTISGIRGFAELADGNMTFVYDLIGLARKNLKIKKNAVHINRRMVRNFSVKRPSKVLVVDDSSAIRSNLKRILKAENVEVKEATNGTQGLNLLYLDKSYDLIITDFEMPSMNGFEFSRTVKNNNLFKNIPIIMITARNDDWVSKKAQANGINDFMLKPFQEDDILKTINKYIGVSV